MDSNSCILCGRKFSIGHGVFKDSKFGVNALFGIGAQARFHACKECAELLRPFRNVASGNYGGVDVARCSRNMNEIRNRINMLSEREYGLDLSEKMQITEHVCDIYQREAEILDSAKMAIRRFLEGTEITQLYNYEGMSLGKTTKNELVLMYLGESYLQEDTLKTMVHSYSTPEQIQILSTMESKIETDTWRIVVPYDDIIYFQEKGDIAYSTVVEGGQVTSKGVSVGGAVAGKLLFGDVGALIGSRAGTGIKSEGITSTVNEHDNRYVVLRFYKSDKSVQEESFGYDVFSLLNTMFPEKEYSYVSVNKLAEKRTDTPLQSAPQGEELIEQLKKLKDLVDIGILTEEEFVAKKKQLLGI